VKHLVVFAAVRAAMAILAPLPRRVALWLGERGGRLAYHVAGERASMAARHARRAGPVGLDPRAGAMHMYANYGRYWAEALWTRASRLHEIELSTSVEGIEFVRAAKAAGSGMIFVLPHLGNWEIAGPVATREGVEAVAVAENLRNRRLRDWFVRLRNSLGIGIVLARSGILDELEAVIRRNGAVALLADRDLSGRGVGVLFFGEETTLPSGPIRLAMRTGAPLLPVASYFDGVGHRVVIRPPLRLTDGQGDEALRRGTRQVAAALEELIRVAPEQWHLLQPNWPSDRAAEGSG
jgi:phosphatidylinositol dimannoside acyltransferase